MALRCVCTAVLATVLTRCTFAAVDNNNVTLYILPADIAGEYGAKCLDGSTPALYVRYTPGNTQWKVHLHGGGWCTSTIDCYYRATVNYDNMGGSGKLPASINTSDNAIFGLMNGDANNTVGGYNLALVMYCDGSSWSSYREQPIVYNGTSIWMRGRKNLDATLAFLERLGGFLTTSSDVILTGTSAGGMATYMHAEYVRARVPPSARVVAMPDAGFFLDAPNMAGVHAFGNDIMAAVNVSLWNVSWLGANSGEYGGANTACLAAFASRPWQCFFPAVAHAYNAHVPFFILNGLFDPAQMGIILGLGCVPPLGNCNATQTAALYSYATALHGNISAAVAAFGSRDGYFLHGCYQHESSCRDPDWMRIFVSSAAQTPNTSFSAWYTAATPPPMSVYRVVDVPWPGDTSCQPYGYVHGGC